MSKSLQDLLDTQDIVDLTIAYGWLLDHGPRAGLRDVFTEDGVAVYGDQTFNGVDEIISKVDESLSRLSISQHIISNQQVAIDGDSATCRCYLHAQHTLRGTEGGDNYVVAGRYNDDLVRTESGWRITKRVLTMDWTEGNLAVLAQ